MRVTEYDVGPGAYGVALAADGAVWASLPERGELVRLGPGGHVSRVRLDAAESRPMVLTPGPDGAIWFSRGDGRIGRVTPAGDVSSVPVASPARSLYGVCAGPDGALWYTLLAADRVGRISLDGDAQEFPLPAGSMPSLITAGPDGALWCTLNQANAGRGAGRDPRRPRVGLVRRDRRRPDRARPARRADRRIPAARPVLPSARDRGHRGRRLLGHTVGRQRRRAARPSRPPRRAGQLPARSRAARNRAQLRRNRLGRAGSRHPRPFGIMAGQRVVAKR
jgi:streptogramin lyase